MARISKSGLDYFPLDVNFLQDRKVRRISSRHHAAGIAALTSLFCLIYKEKGFYIAWNQDTLFDISQEVCCEEEEMQAIIDDCLSVGLFDTYIYKEYGVLTSQAIQEQYHKIIIDSRRKYKLPLENFWMIKEEKEANDNEEETKETKETKERKETKETKGENGEQTNESAANPGKFAVSSNKFAVSSGKFAADPGKSVATMPQTKQETDTDIKSKQEMERENESKSETQKDKETERQGKCQKENERIMPPVPSNSVFQASPVVVEGLSLDKSIGREKTESIAETVSETISETAPGTTPKTVLETAPKTISEGMQTGGGSEAILLLNMQTIGIRNEQTVKAIAALARRKELGGPGGILWKILSSQYRPTLLKKNEPGDYILWALNHPTEFENTYNGTLKKLIRGR